MHWHQKAINEVIAELGASLQGFATADVERLLLQYGANELIEKKRKSLLLICFCSLTSLFYMLLMLMSHRCIQVINFLMH